MLARSASMENRVAMYNGNALKIGLFGANCSSAPLGHESPGAMVGQLARLPRTGQAC